MSGKMENNERLRKLFIGGLTRKTTGETLKEFYKQYGEVVEAVVMKDSDTRESRRFGFVTYAAPSMADEAMKNRPHKIDGRIIDPKRATPRDWSAPNNFNVKKVYVGGLKEQSEEELLEYFGQFGSIVSINIVVDRNTKKRKGYTFIEYNDYDPVDKAVLVRYHHVGGHGVVVKKAVVKKPDSAPGGVSGTHGGGQGRGDAGEVLLLCAPGMAGSYFCQANGNGGWLNQQFYVGGPIRSIYDNAGHKNPPYGI